MNFPMSSISHKLQKSNPLCKGSSQNLLESHCQLTFPEPSPLTITSSKTELLSAETIFSSLYQGRETPAVVNLITTDTQSRDVFTGKKCPHLLPEVEVIFKQKEEEEREKKINKALEEKINNSSYTKKTILSGKILETYTYSRPQKKPINTIDFSKQATHKATPENKEKNRKESLHRARKKLKRIINSNVDQGKRADVFLTLTFKKNIQDVKKGNRCLTLFLQRLRNFLLSKKGTVLKYACCIEFQKRGAIHYHLCFFDFPYIHATILEELWGHGFIKIKKLSNQSDIGSYMTKYLTKNADTDKLRGEKTYWTSRNLEKPLVILGFSNISNRAIEILEKETQKKLLYFFSYKSEYQGYVQYSKYLLENNVQNIRSRLKIALEGEFDAFF